MSFRTLLVITISLGKTNSVSGESEKPVMREHFLDRGDGHVIYWEAEEVKNGLDRVPVFIFHGAWGPFLSGLNFLYSTDKKYRRVTLHQRGFGFSKPRSGSPSSTEAALTNNSMALLMGDVEAVREQLGIHRWIVTGLSMGATQALAYCADYPRRCLGVVLRGYGSCGSENINFTFGKNGKAIFYPMEWDIMRRHSMNSRETNSSLVQRYHDLVNNPARKWEDRLASSRAYVTWDSVGSSMTYPTNKKIVPYLPDDVTMMIASISLHLDQDKDPMYYPEVLKKRGPLVLAKEGVKMMLVVGRQDLLGTPAWSETLRKRMLEEGGRAEMEVVEGASHVNDPGLDEAEERAINALMRI